MSVETLPPLTKPCDDCKGEGHGRRRNPANVAWWEARDEFHSHGLVPHLDDVAWFEANPEPDAYEDWWCDGCEGNGTVITEAGAAILDLLTPVLSELRDKIRGLEDALDEAKERLGEKVQDEMHSHERLSH